MNLKERSRESRTAQVPLEALGPYFRASMGHSQRRLQPLRHAWGLSPRPCPLACLPVGQDGIWHLRPTLPNRNAFAVVSLEWPRSDPQRSLFGLIVTGHEGNHHGEDVKYYSIRFELPTHSYHSAITSIRSVSFRTANSRSKTAAGIGLIFEV